MSLSALSGMVSKLVAKRLNGLNPRLRKQIYAISFYLDSQDQHLVFSVNTRWQVERAMCGLSDGFGLPSDEAEAKWNYAYWLKEPNSRFMTPEDSTDGKAWQKLLKSRGITYSDDDDFDIEAYEANVIAALVDVATTAARRLHDAGTIQAVFQRRIPIVVHRLEYSLDVADWTEAANPKGVAKEFCSWVRRCA